MHTLQPLCVRASWHLDIDALGSWHEYALESWNQLVGLAVPITYQNTCRIKYIFYLPTAGSNFGMSILIRIISELDTLGQDKPQPRVIHRLIINPVQNSW